MWLGTYWYVVGDILVCGFAHPKTTYFRCGWGHPKMWLGTSINCLRNALIGMDTETNLKN